MLNKTEEHIILSALEIVIDGLSSSEADKEIRLAGLYILGLVLLDNDDLLKQDIRKAMLSIIKLAIDG